MRLTFPPTWLGWRNEATLGQGLRLMRRRRRIILWSIAGGLLVLVGVAALSQWQGWIPAWCLVPAVLSEAFGVWLLVRTIRQNIQFAREGSSKRWVMRFGVAVFFTLFGIGLPLATFNLIPDVAWPVGVLLVSLGATFIYRAVVLPNSQREKRDDG